jgi:hypothetical protein
MVKGIDIMPLKVDILAKDDIRDSIKKEHGYLPCTSYYSSLAYTQLKYNLTYAKDEEVFNNDTIHIYARKNQNALFKFILCEDVKSLENFDYSNQRLREFALNRSFENLKIESFDLKNVVAVIIVNDPKTNIELVKRFCFLNSFDNKNEYQMCFRFDEAQSLIRGYRELRMFGEMFRQFNTAIKFDLGVDSIGKKDDD